MDAPSRPSLPCQLLLDSGAFTAHTLGKTIDLQDYIAFIKKNEHLISWYMNLDVLGDAEATWRNQETMEKAGLRPLPVYHILGEPVKYLHRCLEYDYFCLGTIPPNSGGAFHTRLPFVERAFSIICDTPDRLPKAKVHGLGAMTGRLLWRFPWFSVDAATWKKQTGYGRIFVPSSRTKEGKWVYDESFLTTTISERVGPHAHEAYAKCMRSYKKGSLPLANKDYWQFLPAHRRRLLLEYIEEKGHRLGKSSFKVVPEDYECEEDEVVCFPSMRWSSKAKHGGGPKVVEVFDEVGIGNNYYLRLDINVGFFLAVEQSIPPWPWPFRPSWSKNSFGLV